MTDKKMIEKTHSSLTQDQVRELAQDMARKLGWDRARELAQDLAKKLGWDSACVNENTGSGAFG